MTAAYGGWQWGKGSYSAPIDLVGALAPAFTLSATMANPNALRGDMPVIVTIPGATFTETLNLVGNLAPQIGINSANLGTAINLSGAALPINISMAAQMGSGPLWAPDEPCAPVDWEESELCNG